MPTKILVVDDDQDTLRLLKVILENAGFEAVLAEDGRQALHRLEETMPGLVLCDILMPNLPGYDLLTIIRNDPRLRHLPVLMLSALGQEKDVQRALERGADGYVIKPFALRHILAEIRQHVLLAEGEVMPDPRF